MREGRKAVVVYYSFVGELQLASSSAEMKKYQ